MSYVLAFLGFVALIILHEFGHFAVAKAVGMRVERFSLFMGPLLVKVRRGETEYGIGPLPVGGYVKITGMNPHEEMPPEVVPRAYYNQPVWKRIVVILAGPAMNLLIAFFIVWGLALSQGQPATSGGQPVLNRQVFSVEAGTPAASVLRPGDKVVSVDGVSSSAEAIRQQLATHRCAGSQVNGCPAATAAKVVVERDGHELTFNIRPRYVAADKRPELGFSFGQATEPVGLLHAASISVSYLWSTGTRTVSTVVRIFEPQERKQLHSIVYGYTATQESFATSTTLALTVLALISLSLAIINLFPFLPLDGGHVFWAVAEKVRGKRIPFEIMERAGVVGFVLILMIFVIGLTNDISTLSGPGIGIR
ncbi:MAG: site-2 protease family protein [Solirubrobacterales bacterium]|nr:site-2 protease family protein [Solirubrobacterales bacterium]